MLTHRTPRSYGSVAPLAHFLKVGSLRFAAGVRPHQRPRTALEHLLEAPASTIANGQTANLYRRPAIISQPLSAQANANCASRNLPNVQLTPFGRLWKGLCVLPKVLTSSYEDLRQHVILLVHPHELLANDPAEALGVGGQTTEAVVDGA